MMRACSHCHKPYTVQEFVKEESKGMEAERKALGLEGVRFLYYTCQDCGHPDIFVDVHPLQDETEEAYRTRRAELEAAVQQVEGATTGVTLTER
jgi:hypothetical protein